MKGGLEKLPTTQDLNEAYHQILYLFKEEEAKLDLSSFAVFCEWSRFDSRLGEICVGFLSQHWKQLNPVEIQDIFMKQPWPAVLGVLLEFCPDPSDLFQFWKKTATCDFKKANGEQFFIGKRGPGGKLMFDDVRFSLEEYRRWGYFGREILINKAAQLMEKSKVGFYSPGTRTQILKELLKTHSRLTTHQYWEAIGRSVSKRQAERDLLAATFLRGVGNTRGRFFVKR